MSREAGRYLRAGARAASTRFALYLGIVVAPLVFAFAAQTETDHPLLQEIAKGFGLTGFAIVALQPVLAARYRWVERPFGQDAEHGSAAHWRYKRGSESSHAEAASTSG